MRKFVTAIEVQAALRQARQATGLTQREIAECLCVAQQTVSRWELGQSNLSDEMSRPLYTVLTESGYKFNTKTKTKTRSAR